MCKDPQKYIGFCGKSWASMWMKQSQNSEPLLFRDLLSEDIRTVTKSNVSNFLILHFVSLYVPPNSTVNNRSCILYMIYAYIQEDGDIF